MSHSSPIQIFPSLAQISSKFKGILLDAYGVFWGGNDVGLFPGSQKTMEALVSEGKVVGILSNSTQLAAKEIHKLRAHGILEGKHFHFFVTSGEIARSLFSNEKLPFATPNHKFWVFGGGHPRFSSHEAIFRETSYSETGDIQEADFIYVAIPHINGEDQTHPDVFRQEIQALTRKDLPMVCPNPDRFAHEGNPPRAVVRQGSIAALYEEIGGQVFYIGKPHPIAYTTAMQNFYDQKISNPTEILMVGDTPETDIRGAQLFGMPSALITQTGIMADRIEKQGIEKAIQELSSADKPTFFITGLDNEF